MRDYIAVIYKTTVQR